MGGGRFAYGAHVLRDRVGWGPWPSQALPSQADIHQTDLLRKALGAVEIGLMDHIIVAEDSFFSFSEEKLIFA